MDKNSDVISANSDKEYIFPDVIEKICEHLNVADLLSVSKVCTLWESVAHREILHRRQSEMLQLPCTTTQDMKLKNFRFYAFDIARAKPTVALLFFNKYQCSMMLSNNYLLEVIQTYKEQLQCEIIAMRVSRSFFKERRNSLINNDIVPRNELPIPFGIPSVFLTLYKKTGIRISHCILESYMTDEGAARRLYDELTDNISDPWFTVIIFCTRPGSGILSVALSLVTEKRAPHNTSMWGCECKELISVLNDSTDSVRKPVCTAIRLYGSNVKSWTFLINAVDKETFEEHINKFKEGIQLKSHTIGLITHIGSTPHLETATVMSVLVDDIFDVYNNFERFTYLQTFKKAFPTVDFTTITSNICIFGHNTVPICPEQQDNYNVIATVMLITYS